MPKDRAATPSAQSAWLRSSLLERLTDHHPERKREAHETQQIDDVELRRLLRRDLSFLFNATQATASLDLSEFPEVLGSVLNYGTPDLTGHTLSSVNPAELARRISVALTRYESRLASSSLKVRVTNASRDTGKPALFIEIDAELMTEPLPLALRLRAEVDLESGHVAVVDRAREEG